jgi:hypothetical protein
VGLALGLGGAYSPGGTAAQLLGRMGLRPPLAQFRLGDDEYSAWLRAFHGGWVTSGPIDGQPFPALDTDVRSAFPALASLIGWWDHLCAEQLQPVDVTGAFERFLAAPDLAQRMLDPATWRRWGLTRVVVHAQGEPWPVEVAEPTGPRLYVLPTWAENLDGTWLDAVAATVLAGPVRTLRAVRLAPRGRQPGLSTVRVPGGRLHSEVDPAVSLVRLRRQAISGRDTRQASLLRVLANAMVYGNPARFDPDRSGGEKPGPWCFPPLAATVSAAARCVLALVDAQVKSMGGLIAARDTDGVLLVASRRGGSIELPDGTTGRVLSWCDADAVFDRFDALNPFGDGEPFWSVQREHHGGPLHAVVWGPKRHTLFVKNRGWGVVATTEHVIGALVAPPSDNGRGAGGRHTWTEDVAQVLATVAGCDTKVVPSFAWEQSSPDFPALRRVTLSGPDALGQMPARLGFHSFASVIEAHGSYDTDLRLVAPDPGGDLRNWWALPWCDTHTGDAAQVSTDPLDLEAVLIDSLRARSVQWSRPTSRLHRGAIIVDPLLVHPVGRSGGAFTGGTPAAVYGTPNVGAALMATARLLGTSQFVSLTSLPDRTARALAAGRQPRASTVRTAWAALTERFGSEPLPGLLDLAAGSGCLRCSYPGCDTPARPRSRTCSERHRKALSRLVVRDA